MGGGQITESGSQGMQSGSGFGPNVEKYCVDGAERATDKLLLLGLEGLETRLRSYHYT